VLSGVFEKQNLKFRIRYKYSASLLLSRSLRYDLSFLSKRKLAKKRLCLNDAPNSRTLQDLPKMLLVVKALTRKLYKSKQNKLDKGQEAFSMLLEPKKQN